MDVVNPVIKSPPPIRSRLESTQRGRRLTVRNSGLSIFLFAIVWVMTTFLLAAHLFHLYTGTLPYVVMSMCSLLLGLAVAFVYDRFLKRSCHITVDRFGRIIESSGLESEGLVVGRQARDLFAAVTRCDFRITRLDIRVWSGYCVWMHGTYAGRGIVVFASREESAANDYAMRLMQFKLVGNVERLHDVKCVVRWDGYS